MFVSKEKETVLDSHKKKAQLTTEMLNSMDGVQCNEVRGAVYAFPRITLPKRAIEEAKVTSQALSKNARVSVDTPKGVKFFFPLEQLRIACQHHFSAWHVYYQRENYQALKCSK